MTRSRPIVIAGGGIAGLTAAIAFARHGFSVQVFEKASRIEAAGAGIQLSPNATHILGNLGVLEHLTPMAVRPSAVDLKDAATLRTLSSIALGDAAEARWKAPYLVAHRADLQSALLKRLKKENGVQITTSAQVGEVSVDAEGATATVDINGEIISAAGVLLIGADGVRSSVRHHIPGNEHNFTGDLAWRATISTQSPAGIRFASLAATDRVTAFLHPGFHMVAYPVSSGREINLVAFTKGHKVGNSWSSNAQPEHLAKAMRTTASGLIELVTQIADWTIWPLHTVDVNRRWAAPAIALIGDAAHAMTPFAAQGGAMAIEDAATLAEMIASNNDELPNALAIWECERRKRVAKVVKRGAINRLAWHAAGPAATARNLFLKMRSPQNLASDLDWLYGWRMERHASD